MWWTCWKRCCPCYYYFFVVLLGTLGVARLYKNKIMICNYILILSWSFVCCMNILCLTCEATTNIKHYAFQHWIVVLIGIKIFAHGGSLTILLQPLMLEEWKCTNVGWLFEIRKNTY
jgi:hypothetical protein